MNRRALPHIICSLMSGVIYLIYLPSVSRTVTESPGEISREGDSTGIRFGHDSVQGAETT